MSPNPVIIVVGRQDDPPLNQTVEALSAFRVHRVMIEDLPNALSPVLDTVTDNDSPVVLLPFALQLSAKERDRLEEALDVVRSIRPELTVTLAAPIGYDRRVAEIAEERVLAAAAENDPIRAPILTIVGAREESKTFSYADLEALPQRLPDIGTKVPGREGEAIPVHVLLDIVGHAPGEGELVFRSGDEFSANVSTRQARNDGFLVYKLENRPLPARYGGPVRLFIPGGDDRCSNVKSVDTIEIRQ